MLAHLFSPKNIAILAAATALCPAQTQPTASARLPNILVIYVDDLGYGDLGRTGNARVRTPHMDSIAHNGATFANGYVSGAMCSPSRAGLMSGRYQTRVGFEFNYENYETDGNGLERSLTLFPQRLKNLGYTTGFIGKWHLGEAEGFRPEQRGFDENMPNALGTYVKARAAAKKAGAPEPEDITLLSGKKAEDFIERHKGAPWFLYFAPHAVHAPFPVPDRYAARFAQCPPAQAAYYGMIECLDDAVGGILEKLRREGLEENTLIFFASDNGAPNLKPQSGSNGPFRGYKYQLWDGGIHTPMAVQWKGSIPAGRVLEAPVIQLDFLPTAIAAAGGTVDPSWKLDGVNLLPYMTGVASAPPARAPLCWKIGPQYAIREGDWKYIKPYVNAPALLFNLKDDKGETTDCAATHPEKAAQLETHWRGWNADNEPARWTDKRSDLRQGILYDSKSAVGQ